MDIRSVQATGFASADKDSKLVKWQRFVDDALLQTGQVTEAAIYGLDGVKWAASRTLNVSPSEVSKLLTCMTGDSSAVRRGGIKVGGQDYIFLRSEEGRSIYGRKGANAGVCIVKAKTAMIVGVYGQGIQPGNCNAVVEKLADYLIQHNI